jgi:ppGpp synthetase/RelA/SpoT-type nucleotidyltranferase
MAEESIVERFVADYRREVDFYQEAARLCRARCEELLRTRGILGIVSHRAKNPEKLLAKLRQREPEKNYPSADAIRNDIPDLAGVRIALYFPADREKVTRLLTEAFAVEALKRFPILDKPRSNKRFDGYHATHFRVTMRTDSLPEADKRFASARVEIQLGSVLMHAWAEVEHDLVYKPASGKPSAEEHAILDELNGMVLAGEIALERLQAAVETRVSQQGRKFAHQFELASWLYAKTKDFRSAEDGEPQMGRLDILFKLLRRASLDTAEGVAPFVSAVQEETEPRPIADQVADAVLTAHSELYPYFLQLQEDESSEGTRAQEDYAHEALGRFLTKWIELERVIKSIAKPQIDILNRTDGTFLTLPKIPDVIPIPNALKLLRSYEYLNGEQVRVIDQLRRLRNEIVHGLKVLEPDELAIGFKNATEILEQLEQDPRISVILREEAVRNEIAGA